MASTPGVSPTRVAPTALEHRARRLDSVVRELRSALAVTRRRT